MLHACYLLGTTHGFNKNVQLSSIVISKTLGSTLQLEVALYYMYVLVIFIVAKSFILRRYTTYVLIKIPTLNCHLKLFI